LTSIRTTHPPKPLLPFFHPPIELASIRPGSRVYLDRWVDCSAICFGTLLHVGVAKIHI
jgi:hypothetical protein